MAISNLTQGNRPGICTSTTRPTAPYEGQMIFETDTDMVAIWNGSAWRYIAATTPTNGTVLQVVTANYAVEDAKTNSTYGDTGLTATITPKSTSNKILVLVSQNGLFKTGNTAVNCKLLRGATDLSVFAYGAGLTSTAADNGAGTASCIYLDNPATTFATTYKTQFMSLGNVPSALVQYGSAMSTITLMELAG